MKKVLNGQNLQQQRNLLKHITAEFNISIEDCAAALIYLSQPGLYQAVKKTVNDTTKTDIVSSTARRNKLMRYRLDVGSRHQVTSEEIKDILVAESGVDRPAIGRIVIRYHYTLVELPEGMPADIFQLLTEVEIRQQKLNIKRVRQPRNFRYHGHHAK